MPRTQRLPRLERITLPRLPQAALPVFEAALAATCDAVAQVRDEHDDTWSLEAIRHADDPRDLATALALAAAATGLPMPAITRAPTAPSGWLEQVAQNFPPQPIGRTWLVLGTHDAAQPRQGRTALVLDAGLAFGSGEHGSTRGCLRALERLPPPRGAMLDLGTGSGILAIAAAKRFRRPVLATDNDRWSVATTALNARANGVAHLVRAVLEAGHGRRVRAGAPYRLVLANILARPLAAMASDLAQTLAPGGIAILAGLLETQARWVLGAHRRHGLVLRATLAEGRWRTLVVQKTRRRPARMARAAV